MTKPQKTPRQLAEESWFELEMILLEEMRMKMKLYILGYMKGHQAAKESKNVRVRTITPKK